MEGRCQLTAKQAMSKCGQNANTGGNHGNLPRVTFPCTCRTEFSVENQAYLPTIPDKRVGTQSKFSIPPTLNVDNQVIFALFVGKNVLFSNND